MDLLLAMLRGAHAERFLKLLRKLVDVLIADCCRDFSWADVDIVQKSLDNGHPSAQDVASDRHPKMLAKLVAKVAAQWKYTTKPKKFMAIVTLDPIGNIENAS